MTRAQYFIFKFTMTMLWLSCLHHGVGQASDDQDQLRDKYIQAEKYIAQNQWQAYSQLKSKLILYPLYPYLIYKELKQKISTNYTPIVSLEEVLQFEKVNPDFPYHDSLRAAWAKQQASKKNWSELLTLYSNPQNRKNTRDQCYYLQSLYHVKKDPLLLDQMINIWLSGESMPSNCDPLFDILRSYGKLKSTEIIARLKLIIQKQNFALAEYIIEQLPKKEKSWAKQWLLFLHAPENIFSEKKIERSNFPNYIKAEVLTTTLQRLARKDAMKAMQWWDEHQLLYSFTFEQKNRIHRDIAVFMSHQRNPSAYDYISKLPDEKLDNIAKEWRIRLSIYQKKWSDTLKWIQSLPTEEKSKPIWRYWQARAMEQIGSKEYANLIYTQLAEQRDYYGLISSLRMKQPQSKQDFHIQISSTLLLRLESLPAVIRATEFMALNRPRMARVEWFQLIKGLPDIQLEHLAHIAFRNGWHDLCIFTLARSSLKSNLRLRFPIAHEKHILYHAQKKNLDPAWVFAVTRQESAFFHYALSPVGAMGLMQLMPATATYVANKNNISIQSKQDLYSPDKNIELGTTYLKYLQELSHQHPVIATASYNAGPGRTRQWLPKEPVDADIWIENIPFLETRNYVKNVMTSTSVYQQLLGRPVQLSQYMQTVSGKP